MIQFKMSLSSVPYKCVFVKKCLCFNTSLNIQICIAAHEAQWNGTKHSTSNKILNCALSIEIILFLFFFHHDSRAGKQYFRSNNSLIL